MNETDEQRRRRLQQDGYLPPQKPDRDEWWFTAYLVIFVLLVAVGMVALFWHLYG